MEDILRPVDYYFEVCEALEIEPNEEVVSEFQQVDDAIELLTLSGIFPVDGDRGTYTQRQLLDLYFKSAQPTGEALALRSAARACLCVSLGRSVGDDDLGTVGATIRATMPFIFALALRQCPLVTDDGVDQLVSYIFNDALEKGEEDVESESDNSIIEIAHLDLSGCSQLTSATGKLLSVVIAAPYASVSSETTTQSTLLSLRLPRSAMDGAFSAIASRMQQRAVECGDKLLLDRMQKIVEEMDSADASREPDGEDLNEVSFHEMEMRPPPVRGTSVRNQQHDEEWYPEDDADEGGEKGAAKTPTLPSQNHQTPTHFGKPAVHAQYRTVVGSAVPSEDLVEIFNLIEAYQPKPIDLPTRFVFPGPLSFFPAVHAPDPMLCPEPPGPIYVPRSVENPSSADAESLNRRQLRPLAEASTEPNDANRPSMFANFFRSVQSSRSNSPRTPRAGVSASLVESLVPRPPLTARHFASESSSSTASIPTAPRPPEGPQSARGVGGSSFSGANPRRHQPVVALISNAVPARLSPLPAFGGDGAVQQSGGAGATVVVPRLSIPTAEALRSDDAAAAETQTARLVIDPLLYALSRVNDALLGSRARLMSRPLRLPTVVSNAAVHGDGGLADALRDPSFNPLVPTRVALIEASLAKHKLNYNTIRDERRKDIPTWMNAREYVAELLIKPSKAETLSSGSMNDEGTLLATTHYDMKCRIWKAETGELVHTLSGHTNHLSDCAWNAPLCNRVITSSFDKTLKVWDVATGKELHTLAGHELEVVCVAISPDGALCASGGMDDLAIIWDIESGQERFNLLGHEGEVIAIDFSPNGDKVVTGSMDETVRLWNTMDGTQLRKLEGHTAEVNQVKFNCFGNMVISGSIDTTCRLWDVETGQSKVLRGHTHEVVDCDFSPDGWTCASASDDTTIRIWDVLTGGCTMLLVGHTQGVCRLLYTPDGASIISGSLDSTAKVWNVATGACKQSLNGHKGLVIATFNAATDRIITMSRDNTCRIWRLEAPHNSLAGMAALNIARSVDSYETIMKKKVVHPTLARMVEGFFLKLNAEAKDKMANALSTTNRPCNSVPQIPSAVDDEDADAPSQPPEGGQGDASGGDSEMTQVVNLRARSRMFNISRLDEVHVE